MAEGDAMTLLWHVTLMYTLHGQICQNGFYFSNRGAMSTNPNILGPYTQDICFQFNVRIMPSIKNFQNNEVHYRTLVCSTLIPHNGPIGEFTFETGSGNQVDESLPSYSAAILTLRTGFSGKSNRGRLYFAGVSEGDAADSRLIPDSLTALQGIGNELLTHYGDTGSEGFIRYVVFSKKLGYSAGGVYSPAGIRKVTHTIARSALGTQRHRLLGKGN